MIEDRSAPRDGLPSAPPSCPPTARPDLLRSMADPASEHDIGFVLGLVDLGVVARPTAGHPRSQPGPDSQLPALRARLASS